MISQKSYIGNPHGGWFSWELKFLGLFLALISFSNLVFSDNTFALFTPTLSASLDNTAASVNGNQVINSTNKTTEIPLNLTVNTNNKTGYTATLSSETENTALTNITSTAGAKINSISNAGPLGGFSNNTWGYKFGSSTNYAPIPALSTPAQILQTAGKTNGNESNQLSIGMKLSDNLESGRYTNKLIFSILTNNYDYIAIMTEGPDFNTKLKSLETATNKIEHFKKSTVAPAASMNAVNIEDEESDYEIKLWLDSTDKTAYYYAEPEKVYLNTDSRKMFYSKSDEQKIKNILDLDLSNFDTSKVTNMSYMFFSMSNLTSLNLSNFDTSKVTNMVDMFASIRNLTTLDLSNFDTSRVTNMSAMFSGMSSLTSLNLSSFDTSMVTNMLSMFSGMSSLTSLNISNIDTSQVTDMRWMFHNMSSLTTLNLSNFDTSNVTNMYCMFSGMSNLTTLNLSSFDTSKVTDMRHMFDGTSSLTTLNLSSFDTSKVTDMSFMFSGMYSIGFLDISNFNTSKVENMDNMFRDAKSIESITFGSKFNTSKVISMASMFNDAPKLKSLDLSNFDTSNVINMNSMFNYTLSLSSLKFGHNFVTDKVEYMMMMFVGTCSLDSLDLSTFKTTKLTDVTKMFALLDWDNISFECLNGDKLKNIYVSEDFDISNVNHSANIFTGRKNLRGGAGSFLTNPATADKSWLRIDDPIHGRPGYFTRKP